MSMIGNYVPLSPAQLESLKADPAQIAELLYPDDGDSDPPGHIDIDKAWHAIHFLLNGSAWEGVEPWFNVVIGGTPIGEDVGYGPARYLEPWQVKAVAVALTEIDSTELVRSFDPAAFQAAEIYPTIWDRDSQEGLEYVLAYFRSVVQFFSEASERGDAALLYLN